jgi:hypothetical protein
VIDRKTALVCAALIALMLMAAVWQIAMLDDWTTLAVHKGASLPSLFLFVFPAASVLVVGALYWSGRGATANDAKLQPWRKWGKFLSISYCGGLLLLHGVLVVRSRGVDVLPLDLSAVSRTLAVLMSIMSLLAINQMPKLPWFDSRFTLGGDLGPIYGPRYLRTQSRALVAFMIVVIAYNLAAPPTMGWRAVPYILLATALFVVWSVAWRFHLGRKWKLEQRTAR